MINACIFHHFRKVLQKLSLEVEPDVIRIIAQCRPWAVENFLLLLRDKMDAFLAQRKDAFVDANAVRRLPANIRDVSDQPEVDQVSHMSKYTSDFFQHPKYILHGMKIRASGFL